MTDHNRRCAKDSRGTRIERLHLDPSDLICLNIARYYFASFAAPERQGWLDAMAAALRYFGHDKGPHAAMATLSAVQAMRRSRLSTFRFNAADCPGCSVYLSDHERQLLNTLRAMAEDRPEAAAGHAMILCEGNDTSAFLQAAAVMAEVCEMRPRAALPSDDESSEDTAEDGSSPAVRISPKSRPSLTGAGRRVSLVEVPPRMGL